MKIIIEDSNIHRYRGRAHEIIYWAQSNWEMKKESGVIGERFLSSLTLSFPIGGAYAPPTKEINDVARGKRISP